MKVVPEAKNEILWYSYANSFCARGVRIKHVLTVKVSTLDHS